VEKIVVWSWSYVSFLLFLSIYLFAAWAVAIEEGFTNMDSWLSVLPISCLYLFALMMQFTIIEVRNDKLVVRKIGNFRKQTFSLSHIEVRYGVREKFTYRAPAIYPIYIYDKDWIKQRKILCGDIRGSDFDKFWKKHGHPKE